MRGTRRRCPHLWRPKNSGQTCWPAPRGSIVVWAKLIGTPWWVRRPVMALLLAPILVAPVPNVAHSASWAWGLVILGIYGLVFVVLAATLPRPIQCTYLAAF